MEGSARHGQNFSRSPGGSFGLKGEGWVSISSWALANGLAAWSGTWKDHDWKIDDKEVWGAGTWIDFSEREGKGDLSRRGFY